MIMLFRVLRGIPIGLTLDGVSELGDDRGICIVCNPREERCVARKLSLMIIYLVEIVPL